MPDHQVRQEGLSVLVDPGRSTLDIVFIHGFTGHPERTWSHKGDVASSKRGYHENDNGNGGERPPKFRRLLLPTSSHQDEGRVREATYWPQDLIPVTAPNARVLTYGYDTHIRHWFGSAVSRSTVYDIAWDFLVSLESARRSEPTRPLLFIAHSLGGIVVKEALRRSRGCDLYQTNLRSVYDGTRGIFFFGTPHGGADPRGLIQHIAEKCIKAAGFSVNEQIVNTLLPSSERLRELREEFSPMALQESWIIYCFQEQYGIKALNGNKVVDDTASCLNNPGIEMTQHISRNHIDMCRFSGSDDAEYAKVVGALKRVVEAAAVSGPRSVNMALGQDERKNRLESLRFDQIEARHATIKNAHAKTCAWLLRKTEYQDWLDENKILDHHGFLWIKGKPGTGKSTLMKFAFARAKRKLTDTVMISFFFNARGESLERSVAGMYRSLLYQLLGKLPDLQYLFDSFDTMPCAWAVETLKELFRCAISQLECHRLACFIVALDECDEDEVREMVTFFEDLGELAVSSQLRLLVCFSSRHYPHISIRRGIQLTLEGQEGHQQDITNYLHSELKAGRSKLVEDIKSEILERSSGIFLWVALVVQMLNKEYDRGRVHALRKRLDEIPNGLDELFQDILTRDKENMEELRLCLQWILFATRPLRREELYFAILSELEPQSFTSWNSEEITLQDIERFILSSSKGLVEVTKSKDQTVQFIHESVRDFFLRGNGLDRLRSDLGGNFLGPSHERLKLCCHQYMLIDLSEHVTVPATLPKASSEEAASLRQLVSEKFPFLQYATRNVLYHADVAASHGISQMTFVKTFSLTTWITLDNLFQRYQIRRHTLKASLLYILAEENLANLINVELKRTPNMEILGERYHTPLLAASALGNANALKALLAPNIRVRRENDDFSNPVLCYDDEDYQQAVLFLQSLARDKVSHYRFPLVVAAQQGHIALTKVLLASRRCDTNSQQPQRFGALHYAAKAGNVAILELLLAHSSVNVNSRTRSHNWTPLHCAVKEWHNAELRNLGTHANTDVNAKDRASTVPSSTASYRRVVAALLAHSNVDPNSQDCYGRTPLRLAASQGTAEAVRMLLSKPNIAVNLDGRNGETPLSAAARAGHLPVIKLLLGCHGIDINRRDGFLATPLAIAAERGRSVAVELLLMRREIDVNTKDKRGRTPLALAISEGHQVVAMLLLAHPEVDVNAKDNFGRLTWLQSLPRLHMSNSLDVFKRLVRRHDVDVNNTTPDGFTPLWIAASSGLEEAVKLLLARPDIQMNVKCSGETPLIAAARRGFSAIVQLLLERPDVDINSVDKEGRTALSRGAEHEAVVHLLQSYGAS